MNDPRHPTALDRLLGPARAEVTCEFCFEELDRYVDLQVTGADADRALPGMAAHLEGCPACAEEHASLTALITEPDPGSTPWHC